MKQVKVFLFFCLVSLGNSSVQAEPVSTEFDLAISAVNKSLSSLQGEESGSIIIEYDDGSLPENSGFGKRMQSYKFKNANVSIDLGGMKYKAENATFTLDKRMLKIVIHSGVSEISGPQINEHKISSIQINLLKPDSNILSSNEFLKKFPPLESFSKATAAIVYKKPNVLPVHVNAKILTIN